MANNNNVITKGGYLYDTRKGEFITFNGKKLRPEDIGQNMSMQNGMPAPFAVLGTETADGYRKQARMETMSAKSGQSSVTLTLLNTSNEIQKLHLGDGSNFIWDADGYPALNGVVVVDGKWGAQTLAKLHDMARFGAWDMHGAYMTGKTVVIPAGGTAGDPTANGGTGTPAASYTTVDNGDVFSQGEFIFNVMPDPTKSPIKNDWNRVKRYNDGSNLNNTVRDLPEQRFQFQPWSSLEIHLPPLQGVTIQVYINANARTYPMDLLRNCV